MTETHVAIVVVVGTVNMFHITYVSYCVNICTEEYERRSQMMFTDDALAL